MQTAGFIVARGGINIHWRMREFPDRNLWSDWAALNSAKVIIISSGLLFKSVLKCFLRKNVAFLSGSVNSYSYF